MTAILPPSGYLSDPGRESGEMKAGFEALRDVVAQLPGGSSRGSGFTISGGVIAPNISHIKVDTEASAASDNLDSIDPTAYDDGRIIYLSTASSARDVVVVNASGAVSGQIFLSDGVNFTLSNTTMVLELQLRSGAWYETDRFYGSDTAALRAYIGVMTMALLDASSDDSSFATSLKIGALLRKGADIASAATLVKPSTDANRGGRHHVTGTTGISALWNATSYPWPVMLQFDGILTLTHSANLILLGAANITTAAGDIAVFVPESATIWRMVAFERANGQRLDVAQSFTSAQTFKVFGITEGTLADAATIAWNATSDGNVVKVSPSTNRTMGAPTNLVAGRHYQLTVIHPAGGGITLTWNSAFKFKGGVAPTASTTANAIDIYGFYSPDGAILRETGHNFDVK